MRVLTLTALEDVATSGPLRTQTLPLLEGLAERGTIRPSLVGLLPAHRALRTRDGRDAVERRLTSVGVPYRALTVLGRSRVYVGQPMLRWLAAQSLGGLRREVTRQAPDVIHARGYLAAHLADRLGPPFVFDGRGLYREEAIHVGAWARGSSADLFWAAEEARLCRRAACVVAVSEAFRRELPADDLTVIPCVAPSPGEPHAPLPAPVEAFLSAGRPTLTYVGALTSWYAPEALFDAFRRIVDATDWNVLVATGDVALAREVARRTSLPDDRLLIETLHGADVALALTRSRATIWAAFGEPTRLHATQLGIKFAEYAAAGRPILVSHTLASAAALVRASGAGVVLDDAETGTLRRALERVTEDGETMGRAARDLHASNFRLEHAIDAFTDVYRRASRISRSVRGS